MHHLYESQHNDPQQDESQQDGEEEEQEPQWNETQQHSNSQQEEPLEEESQHQSGATATTTTNTKPGRETLPEACTACLCVYKEQQERRPRSLPCGHTLCWPCITSLLKEDRLSCPSCLIRHHATDATYFPVNYALENMISRFKALQAERAPLTPAETTQVTAGKAKQNGEAGLRRKLQSIIKEQRESMESPRETLKQELNHLEQYRVELSLSLAKHSHLLEELNKVGQQHRKAMELLMKEDLRAEAFIKDGEKDMREMKAAQDQLYLVSSAQNAYPIIDLADASAAVVEEWLQHSKEELPNGTAYSTSCWLVENTEAALQVVLEGEDTPESIASGHPSCSILEILKKIRERSVEQHVKLHMKEKLRTAVWGDPVSVGKRDENNCFSFPLVTSAGANTPSPGTFTFRFSSSASGSVSPFSPPKSERPPPSQSSVSEDSLSRTLNRLTTKANLFTLKKNITEPSSSPTTTTTSSSTPTTTTTFTTSSSSTPTTTTTTFTTSSSSTSTTTTTFTTSSSSTPTTTTSSSSTPTTTTSSSSTPTTFFSITPTTFFSSTPTTTTFPSMTPTTFFSSTPTTTTTSSSITATIL